ncbi:mesothelin-like protein [Phaenicophaeus curvirostris]|uniref:mesothelin-like protein n=1 Tax=Phaenicophaeus curvirostris TaxID=33595 RepID=UPI0037F097AE
MTCLPCTSPSGLCIHAALHGTAHSAAGLVRGPGFPGMSPDLHSGSDYRTPTQLTCCDKCTENAFGFSTHLVTAAAQWVVVPPAGSDPIPCLVFSAFEHPLPPPQAALIIGAVLSASEQHAHLSASVPQGFPCLPASDLPAADILAFAQGLQNGTEEPSAAQLSCLARLLDAKNLTADFNRYPPDLLLFFDLAKVNITTCGAFYSQAARGRLALLPRGSAQRRALLRGALGCLGVRSNRLRPEQLESLGALVCDMEPETIAASDPTILENLKLCPELTGAQRDALNAVLLRGDTVYGDPLSWDLQTLQSLGPLVLALNQTTLSLVAKAVREAFGRSIAATYSSQGRSQREKSLTLLRTFAEMSAPFHPRLKRSTDRCLSAPITASTISDPLSLIDYTSEQFNLCLSNEVLEANLQPLMEQPLTVEYLRVVKKKLEQIYPSGIPEEQLRVLGPLSRLYTVEEIGLWPVKSSNTLSALLNPSDGKWEASQVQQLVSRYLALGGTLTGPLLQEIGGKQLCNLQEEQIAKIPPEAIRTAGQLDISSCSQTKKNQLYGKAKEAFADQAGTARAYYCWIWPYLGGAPAKDLKGLAKAGIAVNMDIDTFLALNPDEVQELSVTDVKNLLGVNLPQLKEAENETLVMRWVKRQSQRELDCILGIGLQGGMEEPSSAGTATPPHPTALANVTPTATTPMPTTLLTVSTPVIISSHPTSNLSSGPHKVTTPTPPKTTQLSTSPRAFTPSPSAAVSPAATSTARPAPTTSSTIPCSTHPPATSNKSSTHPPATSNMSSPPTTPLLLTTILATVSPNTTSPRSVPPPAVTQGATTTTSVVTNSAVTTHNTSNPLASTSPPAPGGTIHPTRATPNTSTLSTHNAPSTLLPNSTSAPFATAATEMNLPPHKPTPIPNATISTQKSGVSSVAKTTTPACKTDAPPALFGSSSTTTSSNTTEKTSAAVPEPPRSTPGGYINLQPEPGSGSRLSCLMHVLTTAVGTSLLLGLL